MSKVKLLLYCTKSKPYLWKYFSNYDEGSGYNYETSSSPKEWEDEGTILNGKIVAECDCEKVEKWFWNGWWNCYAKNNDINIQNIDDEDFGKSCLNFGYLYDYLFENDGYALRLSNLKILDKPLAFDKDYIYKDYKGNELITKAPQNMCRVYDRFGNKYILISIRPEWVCKILNGEKTIEVRKQIIKDLKEMKENDK